MQADPVALDGRAQCGGQRRRLLLLLYFLIEQSDLSGSQLYFKSLPWQRGEMKENFHDSDT